MPIDPVKRTHFEIGQSKLEPTPTPFNNIGLAFSGGGFRAAGFALGTLAYLQTLNWEGKPLLHSVSYISSASGGTIANGLYALSLAEGKSFDEFYRELFTNISGVTLLEKVFKNLNDQSLWKDCPQKRRNIINSFALAYNQLFFEDKTARDLKYKVTPGHLDEVCFNTTEFYKGLSFRQAIKLKEDSQEDPAFLYGNYMLHLVNGVELNLKLCDLLAASSCFPAGFEPLLFPDEFIYGDTTGKIKQELLKNLAVKHDRLDWQEIEFLYEKKDIDHVVKKLPAPLDFKSLTDALATLTLKKDLRIGFMDGGITDNQAIESIMHANDRRIKQDTDFKEFDLMLICDVCSHYMDQYVPLKARKYKGFGNLHINGILAIAAIFGIAGALAIWFGSKLLAIVAVIPFLMGLLIVALVLKLKSYISTRANDGHGLNLSKNFSPAIVKQAFHHFGKTPLGVIGDMLKERLSSMVILNTDVFLKRISKLLYLNFLEMGHDSFRMKTNHIYDLAFSNDINRINGADAANMAPNQNIQRIAEYAFEMGTSLWFEHTHDETNALPAILSCAQFTTCYNLIIYINKLKCTTGESPSYFSTLDAAWQQKIDALEVQLRRDYEAFKDDPFWMYNKLGHEYKVPHFKKYSVNSFTFPHTKFRGLRNEG